MIFSNGKVRLNSRAVPGQPLAMAVDQSGRSFGKGKAQSHFVPLKKIEVAEGFPGNGPSPRDDARRKGPKAVPTGYWPWVARLRKRAFGSLTQASQFLS